MATKYNLKAKIVLGKNTARLGEKNLAKYKSWVGKTVEEVYATKQGAVDITYAIKVGGIEKVPSTS